MATTGFFALLLAMGISACFGRWNITKIATLDSNRTLVTAQPALSEGDISDLCFVHSPRFTFMDEDKNGVLSADEIKSNYRIYMANRGRFCDMEFICDHNSDGIVTRPENSKCIVEFFRTTIFPMLDVDQNGAIGRVERPRIKALTEEYFFRLGATEVEWILDYCDVNKDGEIDFTEMLHVDAELTNLDLLRLKFTLSPPVAT